MDNKQLSANLSTTLDELLQLISSFSQAEFNIIPFKDSWTSGQLAQHVILYLSGFSQMLNGVVADTERAPDQQVEKIRRDFLNFDIKFQSPHFIVPPIDNYKKEESLATLRHIEGELVKLTETLDLSKTCKSFEIPVYGFLTRWEALNFVLVHTQRHIHQLKNIRAKIA